jgi:hypothetical protein
MRALSKTMTVCFGILKEKSSKKSTIKSALILFVVVFENNLLSLDKIPKQLICFP